LLWYALAHGQAGFTREEACADLFPELDAERGGRALRNVLYELRKLLRDFFQVQDILDPRDGRLCLMPSDLSPNWEADTQTLQTWLESLRTGGEPAGDVSLLVGGHYLADLDGEWTRPFRHYWESEALHALDLAATYYERAGCPAEALACLRRAIEFSPDDVTLLRRVMLLYHALDDPGGLRAAYLLHRRTMREELAAEPDPDVTALYETLTRS
jgi:two-component SAPR family response regulator